MLRFLIIWGPMLLMALFITWLSIIKAPDLSHYEVWWFNYLDKPVHLFIYAVLAMAVCRSFQLGSIQISIGILFFMVFTFGMLMETVQYFLPNRSFEIFDIIANSLGIILGIWGFRQFFTQKTE